LLTGLIGVAATLLGSFITYLFQSRTAERSQAHEREERLRQELVTGDPRLVRLADAAFTAVGAISDSGYAVPATPMRLPSGSVKCPTTSPDGARSGPITRLPPSRSARCRAASTSATPT